MGQVAALLAITFTHQAWAAPADEVCTSSGTCSSSQALAAGWAEEAQGDGKSQPCREVLEVLHPGEWSRESWRDRPEPAVLAGVAGDGGWDTSAFDRQRLAADFGAVRVKVFSPAQAALLQGQTARRHAIKHVLAKLKDAAQLLYVFDPEFFNHTSAQAAATVPDTLALPSGAQLLTLGGPRAGTQFHAHGPAFLALLAGRKRWYLHRPGSFPNASVKALRVAVGAWEEKVLPTLASEIAPVTCVQHPGDTIFVPDSWAHATVNVDETVGVAWQSFTATRKTCDHGQDYFCLQQEFASVELLPVGQRAQRLKELFAKADELTAGFPWGSLRFLGMYQALDPDGRRLFDQQKAKVLAYLKKVKANSDGAVLAAALTKTLADAAFFARGDAVEVSELLHPAAQKVPESGLCLALAQVLGKQQLWKEAVGALERHLEHFPEDSDSRAMLQQAKQAAGGGPVPR